jgi:CheY-like chemotaxis protein
MLVNLLSNAVKFTPEGGKLGLQVNGDFETRQVVFSVWDTGIGIKPDDLQYLFKPFIQLDAGLTRSHTGSGLGLALVAEMARLHGGSVQVESTPGEGSRFSIILPCPPDKLAIIFKDDAPTPQAPSPVGDLPAAPANARILLVEDTETVSMLLQDYLESLGYQVFLARDGLEGVAQAKKITPDAVLMDVQMPIMDGLEATQLIRAEPNLQSMPIIALTALAMPGDADRCLAAGMTAYLSKPIKLQELSSLLATLLEKN